MAAKRGKKGAPKEPVSSSSSEADDCAESWVQCDRCNKWRRLPTVIAEKLDDKVPWYCEHNPNTQFASCSIAQELTNEEIDNLGNSSSEEEEEEDGACQEEEQQQRKRIPAVWQLIRTNAFGHRKRRVQDEDDVMICNCQPTWRGGDGCGPRCINRMLCIECSPGFCPCEDKCTNQAFSKRQYADLEVRRAGPKGFGLFINAPIKAGQFLIEYVGEALEEDEYQRRKSFYQEIGQRHYYFMNVGNGEVIDACRKGNVARFINHSCNPNCETQKWLVKGELAIGLFATKDMDKDEELTFDYNFERYSDKPMRCYCKSAACRQFIGGGTLDLQPGQTASDTVQEEVQEEDASADLPPIMVAENEMNDHIQTILDWRVGAAFGKERDAALASLQKLCQSKGVAWEPSHFADDYDSDHELHSNQQADVAELAAVAELHSNQQAAVAELVDMDDVPAATAAAAAGTGGKRPDASKPASTAIASTGAGAAGAPKRSTPGLKAGSGKGSLGAERLLDLEQKEQRRASQHAAGTSAAGSVKGKAGSETVSAASASVSVEAKSNQWRGPLKMAFKQKMMTQPPAAGAATVNAAPPKVRKVMGQFEKTAVPSAPSSSDSDGPHQKRPKSSLAVSCLQLKTQLRGAGAGAGGMTSDSCVSVATTAAGTHVANVTSSGSSRRNSLEGSNGFLAGSVAKRDGGGGVHAAPVFLRKRSEIDRRLDSLIGPSGRLKDASHMNIINVLRMFNLCDIGQARPSPRPFGAVAPSNGNGNGNGNGVMTEDPSSTAPNRPRGLIATMKEEAAAAAAAERSGGGIGGGGEPSGGGRDDPSGGGGWGGAANMPMTARQRSRMADLSLLLDIVLRTSSLTVKKEFVSYGLLNQLHQAIGRNFSREYSVILRKILRVVEGLPLSANDVHSVRSAHGTFVNVLQELTTNLDFDVRTKAATLLKRYPATAVSNPVQLLSSRGGVAVGGAGGGVGGGAGGGGGGGGGTSLANLMAMRPSPTVAAAAASPLHAPSPPQNTLAAAAAAAQKQKQPSVSPYGPPPAGGGAGFGVYGGAQAAVGGYVANGTTPFGPKGAANGPHAGTPTPYGSAYGPNGYSPGPNVGGFGADGFTPGPYVGPYGAEGYKGPIPYGKGYGHYGGTPAGGGAYADGPYGGTPLTGAYEGQYGSSPGGAGGAGVDGPYGGTGKPAGESYVEGKMRHGILRPTDSPMLAVLQLHTPTHAVAATGTESQLQGQPDALCELLSVSAVFSAGDMPGGLPPKYRFNTTASKAMRPMLLRPDASPLGQGPPPAPANGPSFPPPPNAVPGGESSTGAVPPVSNQLPSTPIFAECSNHQAQATTPMADSNGTLPKKKRPKWDVVGLKSVTVTGQDPPLVTTFTSAQHTEGGLPLAGDEYIINPQLPPGFHGPVSFRQAGPNAETGGKLPPPPPPLPSSDVRSQAVRDDVPSSISPPLASCRARGASESRWAQADVINPSWFKDQGGPAAPPLVFKGDQEGATSALYRLPKLLSVEQLFETLQLSTTSSETLCQAPKPTSAEGQGGGPHGQATDIEAAFWIGLYDRGYHKDTDKDTDGDYAMLSPAREAGRKLSPKVMERATYSPSRPDWSDQEAARGTTATGQHDTTVDREPARAATKISRRGAADSVRGGVGSRWDQPASTATTPHAYSATHQFSSEYSATQQRSLDANNLAAAAAAEASTQLHCMPIVVDLRSARTAPLVSDLRAAGNADPPYMSQQASASSPLSTPSAIAAPHMMEIRDLRQQRPPPPPPPQFGTELRDSQWLPRQHDRSSPSYYPASSPHAAAGDQWDEWSRVHKWPSPYAVAAASEAYDPLSVPLHSQASPPAHSVPPPPPPQLPPTSLGSAPPLPVPPSPLYRSSSHPSIVQHSIGGEGTACQAGLATEQLGPTHTGATKWTGRLSSPRSPSYLVAALKSPQQMPPVASLSSWGGGSSRMGIEGGVVGGTSRLGAGARDQTGGSGAGQQQGSPFVIQQPAQADVDDGDVWVRAVASDHPDSWDEPNAPFERFVADMVRFRLGKYVQSNHPNHISSGAAGGLLAKMRLEVVEKERRACDERRQSGARAKLIERRKLEGNIKEYVRLSIRRFHGVKA